MIAREVIWSYPAGPGMEHMRLSREGPGYKADGLYVGRGENGAPYRLRYIVEIDEDWGMRSLVATLLLGETAGPVEIALTVDDSGAWRDAGGGIVADLNGCHEADIAATPFTNTLPIRRLGLSAGESAEISVAYIDAPDLRVRPVRQRYTCVRPFGPGGGQYRYEALFSTLSSDLTVDADGLVIDYSGHFERIWDGVATQDAPDGKG